MKKYTIFTIITLVALLFVISGCQDNNNDTTEKGTLAGKAMFTGKENIGELIGKTIQIRTNNFYASVTGTHDKYYRSYYICYDNKKTTYCETSPATFVVEDAGDNHLYFRTAFSSEILPNPTIEDSTPSQLRYLCARKDGKGPLTTCDVNHIKNPKSDMNLRFTLEVSEDDGLDSITSTIMESEYSDNYYYLAQASDQFLCVEWVGYPFIANKDSGIQLGKYPGKKFVDSNNTDATVICDPNKQINKKAIAKKIADTNINQKYQREQKIRFILQEKPKEGDPCYDQNQIRIDLSPPLVCYNNKWRLMQTADISIPNIDIDTSCATDWYDLRHDQLSGPYSKCTEYQSDAKPWCATNFGVGSYEKNGNTYEKTVKERVEGVTFVYCTGDDLKEYNANKVVEPECDWEGPAGDDPYYLCENNKYVACDENGKLSADGKYVCPDDDNAWVEVGSIRETGRSRDRDSR